MIRIVFGNLYAIIPFVFRSAESIRTSTVEISSHKDLELPQPGPMVIAPEEPLPKTSAPCIKIPPIQRYLCVKLKMIQNLAF